SREDPFPLVCLEAAALGVPVVCFEGAGGIREFVENDAGFVVPYLDVRGAADAIVALARSRELRNRLGARAAEKGRARHDVSGGGQQVAALFDRYLPSSRWTPSATATRRGPV